MHTSPRFEGIWLPIVTPFHRGDVDHRALARLARHYAAAGIAGFVAGATTGEGVLLDAREQDAVFATLRDAVPDRPIVVGLTASATHAAAARARELAALRPDGLLVTPPVYVRPTQDGIRRHVEAIVEAADLPVLVYNIPYRTGVNVELDTLQALARDARVAGIKECGGTLERMSRLVHETPLAVLSGDDNQNFGALCAGAHGTIASSAHVLPAWHVRMHALLRDGLLADARRIAVALQPLVAALFAEPNPAPVKAVLAAQGWCDDGLRLPFVPASDALRARLRTLCAELDAHAPASAMA
ncbi:4-hydroxy-tetrahydrodipicolinate synthase [Burkholderia multivorans]|uniref:4-hydroxy-tetrahydrodipicolinate synthase n=1 Tax=Burkholderia multivorans TaxID=87883 RepID=UPI000DACEF01|nr:4-hydroxy-tetrahydrodipicolinate synthase [Burkholderia multivorans]MBR7899392.1 4-hydroxy-tetrahydrodipicolinate synthase [Burkholderia multivorans]RAA23028.1 4-hydroxy-tetrahydrodipicolinate synthase [Burkholderia multivorans]RAA28150.1 4-hydroxy-tetrahydrodipicolinate synthase [Burkholderia multivorans]RAA33965.1 4-hydroxy-tetrahydrodipicolinate synthase [Burkholderia multivorans]RAA42009.1 4-hydroxy-tetrahydrodipicolinate synthase [Burkholderia multivorans]